MESTPHVNVRVDLGRIRRNVTAIATSVAVPVWAVVKADAYGLGVASVVGAVSDLVAGFCTFTFQEAAGDIRLRAQSSKPVIILGPPHENVPAEQYREYAVRPAVSTLGEAMELRGADPVLCVDTGMQRFACPPQLVERVLDAGGCREAFTHATSAAQATRLRQLVGGRGLVLHAAASGLLGEPDARLDLVRPGLAMYAGAVRVRAPLVELHDGTGPAGYTGFVTPRHGVILAGYSHGLRPGLCLVNGERRRVLEVGMQSAFVEIGSEARVGDEVVLLGDGLTEQEIATEWRCTPHEVLMRLVEVGTRDYLKP